MNFRPAPRDRSEGPQPEDLVTFRNPDDPDVGFVAVCATGDTLIKLMSTGTHGPGTEFCKEHWVDGKVSKSFDECPFNTACGLARAVDGFVTNGNIDRSSYVVAHRWLPGYGSQTITLRLAQHYGTEQYFLKSRSLLSSPWEAKLVEGSLTGHAETKGKATAQEIVDLVCRQWKEVSQLPETKLSRSQHKVLSAVDDAMSVAIPRDKRLWAEVPLETEDPIASDGIRYNAYSDVGMACLNDLAAALTSAYEAFRPDEQPP